MPLATLPSYDITSRYERRLVRGAILDTRQRKPRQFARSRETPVARRKSMRSHGGEHILLAPAHDGKARAFALERQRVLASECGTHASR